MKKDTQVAVYKERWTSVRVRVESVYFGNGNVIFGPKDNGVNINILSRYRNKSRPFPLDNGFGTDGGISIFCV